jgi:glycosyltransferase involved in cell wall biosynthesis
MQQMMETRTLASRSAARNRDSRRLRVGVLVDLPLGLSAGGHVRCWERLAEAACDFADQIDVTVHFMGPRPARRDLSETVRYRVEPPVFGTNRLRFLSHVPDHTDLAPWHPRLARYLPDYDVIHTTDAYFAYARTAMAIGSRRNIPIVNSVHTNTPEYARLFTAQTIERLFGTSRLSSLLLSQMQVAQRMETHMLRRLASYQRRCAYVLASRPEQLGALREMLDGRAALLRRGIDRRLFHPAWRDRAWLAARYGIPPERLVVMAAGRLNRGKNILLLAEAVRRVVDAGVDAHLLCAGEGEDRTAVREHLGPRATCPGNVEPAELARLYAAADLFALPSRIEESANVLLEALASGLPVLVARDSGMGRAVLDEETGLLLSGADPCSWQQALTALAAQPARRRAMARAARDFAETAVPSWHEVLGQDLLPHWQQAARQRRQAAG